MYNVTDDFINQIGIAGKEVDTRIINGNNEIIPHTFKHSFSGNIFTSIMQKIELEVKNGAVLTENTVLQPKYGLKVNGDYEYIDYSDYNVYSSEINYDTGIVKTVAYDNMIKFMVKYELEKLGISFPITIRNLSNAICNYVGTSLYSTDFFNADLIIETDLFTALNCTYRDVIDYICQATLTTAIIKDNKLYFKNTTNTNKTITPSILKKFKLKQQFGGCNSLVLGRGDLNDNIYAKDDDLIEQDGLQEIRFDNNEILDKRREEVIDSMFLQVKGLKYYSFETKDLGIGIFEPADFCKMEDLDGNKYEVLILNQSITITSGCEGSMSADTPDTSTTLYQYATDSQKRQTKTEITVDKQNQVIESVISNVSEQNNKISQITQTVDEINSKIQDIADITTSAESAYATVSLENINESEPIELRIHPITTNISYLYPRNNLYPSDTLYMPDRKIRFIRTYEEGGETLTENIDYILPDDLLYYDSNNYDEFYLNYDSQTCQVIKKCKYNADGSVGLLSNTVTTDYTYPQILLGDGNYQVKILGYNTGYIATRLMAKNIYTSQFYTKAETDSNISETARQIDLSVNQKLSNYSTTSQMNSAISLSANNILSSVSESYATKTELDNTETTLDSKIDQTAQSITTTVSATYATKTELNTAKSQIKQTTDAISLEVEGKLDEQDFTSANIILALNNDSSSATIKADKISLERKRN